MPEIIEAIENKDLRKLQILSKELATILNYIDR